MVMLLIILMSSSGYITTKTLPFDTEKHCQMAAHQIEQKNSPNLQVQTVCFKRGIKP